MESTATINKRNAIPLPTSSTANVPWLYYLGFAIFRIINVLFIQSQFDPDEYWQNLEPAYCHVFREEGTSCQGLTWEWKQREFRNDHENDSSSNGWILQSVTRAMVLGMYGPVRSFASIVPTLVFYKIVKTCGIDTSWMVSRGPVFLNAILVAAPTDWAVWYLSRFWTESTTSSSASSNVPSSLDRREKRSPTNYKENDINPFINFCVYCALTSWFNAYAMVRTYSNSLETVLFVLSVVLVSPELLATATTTTTSEKVIDRNMRGASPRACLAFFLGGICSSIRFTCLAAYIPMGLVLSWLSYTTMTSKLSYLLEVCALFGFLGFLSTVILDRIMFGYWAIPVLGNFHFNVIQSEFGAWKFSNMLVSSPLYFL